MKTFLFLAEGFEETEAIATLDILRRAGIDARTVSITGNSTVTGAHNIALVADELFDTTDFADGAMLILPGGMPGARHLNEHAGLRALLLRYYAAGKRIAAICAAPLVLGSLNLLKGKRATAYPGFEDCLTGATLVPVTVVKDGTIITSRGPGFVFDFGLALVAELLGKEKADEVADGLLVDRK
jgi:4-methyl-5(b-hydroxyethyl)-thiazole monophosphate biosynthesis